MTILVLPKPPSPNTRSAHPLAEYKRKNDYRRECWATAIKQTKPPRDPAAMVVVSAMFYVTHLMDPDNLAASLKYVYDCLKQKQTGHVRWRQGVYDKCGWMIDDDPAHLTIASIGQKRVPRKVLVRLELELQDAAEQGA